jgi:hypothetical protein
VLAVIRSNLHRGLGCYDVMRFRSFTDLFHVSVRQYFIVVTISFFLNYYMHGFIYLHTLSDSYTE